MDVLSPGYRENGFVRPFSTLQVRAIATTLHLPAAGCVVAIAAH
jgi:hypothetical protein